MTFLKKLFDRTSYPESRPHEFNEDRICIRCGSSEKAIRQWNWTCEPAVKIDYVAPIRTHAEWMTSYLDVSHFRHGCRIHQAKSREQWRRAAILRRPAWCYYDFNPEMGKKYGKLYNWYAVNDFRGLAPKGWRIPSARELDDHMKTISFAQDVSRLLAGGIYVNWVGFIVCRGLGKAGYIWSSTKSQRINAYCGTIHSGDYSSTEPIDKRHGVSVLCIRE